jgi:hypothetical protein
MAGAANGRKREEARRMEHRVELEARQKVWRWVLLAALGGLLLETWWAGRLSRRQESEGS